MASPSISNQSVTIPFSRADLDTLHEIPRALESILWMCEPRESNRTAESVHFQLGPWDSRLSTLIEKLNIRLCSVPEGGVA